MKSYESLGLRIRILVLGIAILLPILSLLIYQTRHYSQAKIDDYKMDASNLAALVVQTGELQFSHYQQLLEGLALSPSVAEPDNKQACNKALAQATAINPSLGSLTLYNLDGEVICSSEILGLMKGSNSTFVAEALHRKTPMVSDYFFDQVTGKNIIAFALPMLDQKKSVRSVLVAGLDLTWLDNMFNKLPMAEGTNIVVLDGKGVILIPKRWVGQSVSEHPVYKHIAGTSTVTTFEERGIDGLERIFAARPLHSTPGGQSYVWVAFPRVGALTLFMSELLNQSLIAFGAIVVLFFLIWRMSNSRFFRPLDRLRESATLIGQGMYSTRTNLPHVDDEIGRLAASIDEMAAAIETSDHWRNIVLDSAQLGGWEMDLQHETFVRTLRHDQIFGYETLQSEWNRAIFKTHTLPEDREHIRNCYAQALATGRLNMEVRIVRPDGAIRWISSLGQVLCDEQKRPVRMVGIVGDITERKIAEANLKNLNRTLRLISQCNETLVRTTNEDELLQAICRHIVDIGGYRLAWVGYAHHDMDKSVLPASYFGQNENYLQNLHITWADEVRGRGPVGTAIRERRSVVAHNTQTDQNFAPWRDSAHRHGFASTLALPLRSKDVVVGALCIYAAEPGAFDNEEINLLQKLADDLAYGITSLREAMARENFERQLNYQANYDSITGLANRTLFIDRLNQAIVYAGRGNRLVAVMLIDLDRFKTINDSLGHAVGDQLLKQMGKRLANILREGDTVARLSVDEFGVVLSDMAIAEDVIPLAHKLLHTIAQPLTFDEQEIFITGSAGISFYPRDGENAETLLQGAYSAMHSAKSLGGNNFHFYARDMNQRVSMRLALDGAMRRALDHNELQVHYQPKVSLTTGQIMGGEALIRWPHPEMGMIPPMDFIPLAEETGMIVRLGEWVLNHVCQKMRTWIDAGVSVQPMAVNLSARQFRQENLPMMVRQALHDNNLDPQLLELEITESTAMFDVEKAVTTLQELKQIGVKLSLDDFGTGYSSLTYLKRFPIDHLKIDRAFVRDITFDPDDAAICTAVIGLAHNLKMRVIAEGVETQGQMNYLRLNHCDEMQGYYFSRAVPADEFVRFLTDRKSMALL